jgi:Arc/MetJ-type ribon-helix-helix transcriptional regulator
MLAYMATAMVRTTVKLPEEVDARLRHEAARRRTTVSALVREAIESYLGLGPRRRLLSAGAGSSDETDVSERIDEILAAEWGRSH